jgi:large subunit ribosomal protein L3e
LQVNGGSIEEKVDYAYGLFEKPVKVTDIFEQDEMIDTIAITKGRGTEGVVTRWGVTRLPRKTHRGLRKVRSPSVLHAPLLTKYFPRRPACLLQGSPLSVFRENKLQG